MAAGDDEDDEQDAQGKDATGAEMDALLRELARTAEVPCDEDRLLGLTLGRFTLTARLGAGGMGVVYRAHDAKLGRDVALKVLSPSLAHDDTARARLLREARAAAVIQHSTVAAVYDAGEDGEVSFIALELVEGLNLRERLRRSPTLPLHEVRTIAKGVAAALAAAHEAGVVHRDLKPDNIVLTHTSGVKVLDFGLARRLDDDSAAGATPLTREGEVLGTIGYLSPEQALGKPLDARSDVFSFGILVYEMLSARLPFSGVTWGEAAVSLVNERPLPLKSLRSDVPDPYLEIVERCLARSPDDRFANGAALVEVLQRIPASPAPSSSEATVTPSVDPSGARVSSPALAARGSAGASLFPRVGLAAAVLVLVAGGVLLGARWSSWWGPPEPPSLESIPVVSDDVAVQRSFRVAVQSFYAGDMPASARGLDEVLSAAPNSMPAIALRILTGRPESGGHTRSDMLDRMEAAAQLAEGREAAVGSYLASLWRRMNVDAEGHSISSDVSSLLKDGRALLNDVANDYFTALLLTASLPTESVDDRLAYLDALLAIDDGAAVVWLWKIWTMQRGNRADDASRVLERALLRHPGNGVLRRERGIVAALQRDFDVAQRELRRVLAEDPTDTYARIELAGVLWELGREQQWRKELERVLDGPSRAAPAGRAVLASVTSLIAQGRFEEARPLVDRAFQRLHEAARFDIAASFLSQRAREELLVGRPLGARAWLGRMEELIAMPELDDNTRRRLLGDRVRLAVELHLLEGDAAAAEREAKRLDALSDEHFPPDAGRDRTRARFEALLAARRGLIEPALLAFEKTYDGSARQPRDDEEALAFLAGLRRDVGELDAADAMYARVLAQRARCEARVLWWEGLCRVHLAEASVSRAEIAHGRGDYAAARAHLDELQRIWPRADESVPIVTRARAVFAAITPGLDEPTRAPSPPP